MAAHLYLISLGPEQEDTVIQDFGEVEDVIAKEYPDLPKEEALKALREYYDARSTERTFYEIRERCPECEANPVSDNIVFCRKCWNRVFS